ncbi:unnamed protein product [Didymodactylos carnosus]|uniref:IRG-type G domain-containing protein n=1 Tax=Didymodactylos carnosus TaxID=1234261 RepID=A0A814H0I5_9BILA|nr:unnamed protein product [Didymodactylos carnosus]CAF1191919.1 unnamed protein product [Didymodactylos carnosus]CAF3774413.1 unnamed protein product [Didymodactylos carnosus]CAF4002371.1 unnamed protein product [Didymodactylos carnosus]
MPYNVAVIGRSGVGKSSFINTIRNINSEHSDSAAVGVIETTIEPKCYRFETNAFLWDVQGLGTPSVSKDTYCTAINILRYDMFLILSRGRFLEDDLWLANIVRDKLHKNLFFIRTGTDEELRNHRSDYPKKFNETRVLDSIRENCLLNLYQNFGTSNTSLYLINAKDKSKYDFPLLIKDIINHINGENMLPILTLINDDNQTTQVPSQEQSVGQIVGRVAYNWARFGLISYIYDKYKSQPQ